MKIKTITKALGAKFDRWVDTIEDKVVQDLVEKNTIITGGCITSMLLDEEVNDYDIYFSNKETVVAVAEYYTKLYKKENKDCPNLVVVSDTWDGRVSVLVPDVGVVGDEAEALMSANPAARVGLQEYQKPSSTGKYTPVSITGNAITLSDDVQLVLRFYGCAHEIHEYYDFVHCTNYWTSWDREVVTSAAALESILTKDLKYQGSQYPVCSIIRTRKFIERGWTINAGQYLKMAIQIGAMVTNSGLNEDFTSLPASGEGAVGFDLNTDPAPASTPPMSSLSKEDFPEGDGPAEVTTLKPPKWTHPNAPNWMLSDTALLQDQLVGVDSHYFSQFIRLLKEGGNLEESYVFNLIDQIF